MALQKNRSELFITILGKNEQSYRKKIVSSDFETFIDLQRDIRPEIEAELRNDIKNTVRQELEQEYYEKLAQIAELRDKERAEFEAETTRIQQSNTETNQLETQNQELLEKLEQTIEQANQAAQNHVS